MQQNKLLNQRKIWTISKWEENGSFEESSEHQNSQKKETSGESSKMMEITQGCITHVKDFYHYLKKNGEMTECF